MAYTVIDGKLVRGNGKATKPIRITDRSKRVNFPTNHFASLRQYDDGRPSRTDAEMQTKGLFRGLCNRMACLSRDEVEYYNHSTRAFYCPDCAHWLNSDKFNKHDAMTMWGHDLCQRVVSIDQIPVTNWEFSRKKASESQPKTT